MKATKLFAMMLCCMATLAFTACLSDDDNDNRLTPQQRRAAFEALRGNYEGKVVYVQAKPTSPSDRTDTLDVSWKIDNDSVIVVENLPGAALAEHVRDSALASQIALQPAQSVKLYYTLFGVSPVSFFINPATVVYQVDYDGGRHEVAIAFYLNTSQSIGALDTAGKAMSMTVVPAGVYVDKQLKTSLLPVHYPVLLTGKKP